MTNLSFGCVCPLLFLAALAGAGDTAKAGNLVRQQDSGVGDLGFAGVTDSNADGVINILDVAAGRINGRNSMRRVESQPWASLGSETIAVYPAVTVTPAGQSISFLVLLSGNTTPVLGYSVDIEFDPPLGSVSSIWADVQTTNFFDPQNLITAAGGTRDPLFSVIQSNPSGGVFVNTITNDNSTMLAVDGANDVLAEVYVDVPRMALGDYQIVLSQITALSDGNAQPIPFTYAPAIIRVTPPIPAASAWGLASLFLGMAVAATILLRRTLAVASEGRII